MTRLQSVKDYRRIRVLITELPSKKPPVCTAPDTILLCADRTSARTLSERLLGAPETRDTFPHQRWPTVTDLDYPVKQQHARPGSTCASHKNTAGTCTENLI